MKTKSILSVLVLGSILSLSACASSGSRNLAEENTFFNKAMDRCHNYLEGVNDPKNESWCLKHIPAQKGILKNVSPGSAMGGGNMPGMMGGGGMPGIGGYGVSGKIPATHENVALGLFDTFFEQPTSVSAKCQHSHKKSVSYSIVVKRDGHVVNHFRVATTPGCRVVASSLNNIPYLASETKVLDFIGLGSHPVIDTMPGIAYVTTGLQVAISPNKNDPSKVKVTVREEDLVKMVWKDKFSAPVLGRHSIDGQMVLKKGVFVEFPKTFSTMDKNNKIHKYTVEVKEA